MKKLKHLARLEDLNEENTETFVNTHSVETKLKNQLFAAISNSLNYYQFHDTDTREVDDFLRTIDSDINEFARQITEKAIEQGIIE